MNFAEIKELLDEKYLEYCTKSFVEDDPISIPHLFSKKEDIEIAGFFSALLAWGQRQQIIRSAKKLMLMMDNDPFNFIISANHSDLKPMKNFVYRTFNGEDCLFFVKSLRNIYSKHHSPERIFTEAFKQYGDIGHAITIFREIFFEPAHLPRSEKHLPSPLKNSACKRINLFLRWMIRSNDRKVDFGLWKEIPPSSLYCPLDLHTGNVSRELGLLKIQQNNWKAVEELTCVLKKFDPNDPVKYDFSLFGLGFYTKYTKFDV